MKDYELNELLDRLEGMRETLREEHGAEWDYFAGEFRKELAPLALDLGLELLKCRRPDEKDA